MAEWIPDEAVVDAVLDGRKEYADLGREDSRWVVASLTHRGYSVAEIAEWLRCSTRQVKRVRAELVTQVMGAFAAEREESATHLRRFTNMRREVRRLREENAELQVANDVQVSRSLSQLREFPRARRHA